MTTQPTTGAGAHLLANLPPRFQPDPATIARLAPKVDVLLAAGWSAADLARRFTAGADSEHNPVGAVARRIERFPLPKGVQPPSKPAWCGKCDEHTRMREKPDTGLPYRCPACHPKAVAPAS